MSWLELPEQAPKTITLSKPVVAKRIFFFISMLQLLKIKIYICLLFLFNYNTPKNVKERGLKIVSEKIHNKGIIIF